MTVEPPTPYRVSAANLEALERKLGIYESPEVARQIAEHSGEAYVERGRVAEIVDVRIRHEEGGSVDSGPALCTYAEAQLRWESGLEEYVQLPPELGTREGLECAAVAVAEFGEAV